MKKLCILKDHIKIKLSDDRVLRGPITKPIVLDNLEIYRLLRGSNPPKNLYVIKSINEAEQQIRITLDNWNTPTEELFGATSTKAEASAPSVTVEKDVVTKEVDDVPEEPIYLSDEDDGVDDNSSILSESTSNTNQTSNDIVNKRKNRNKNRYNNNINVTTNNDRYNNNVNTNN
jgi:hypothetical protein